MFQQKEFTMDQSERIQNAADDLAYRVETFADRVGDALDRFSRDLRKAEDAVVELGEDLERPAARVIRAAEDFAYEARKSYERALRRSRPKRFGIF